MIRFDNLCNIHPSASDFKTKIDQFNKTTSVLKSIAFEFHHLKVIMLPFNHQHKGKWGGGEETNLSKMVNRSVRGHRQKTRKNSVKVGKNAKIG